VYPAFGPPSAEAHGIYSYNYGTARVLTAPEIDAIEAWVRLGNGIATTSSYFYTAPEAQNVNAILSRFGLKYATTDPAGHIVSVLNGQWGTYSGIAYNGGADVGQPYNFISNDFYNTQEPLVHTEPTTGYSATVKLLQVRSAVPLVNTGVAPGSNNWITTASEPATCLVRGKMDCPLPTASVAACLNNYTALPCAANNTNLPACLGAKVENIGAGNGRVMAWGDEWLTYDTVWNNLNSCVSDPTKRRVYEPDIYWENVVRWLGQCK